MFVGLGRVIGWGRRPRYNACSDPIFDVDTVCISRAAQCGLRTVFPRRKNAFRGCIREGPTRRGVGPTKEQWHLGLRVPCSRRLLHSDACCGSKAVCQAHGMFGAEGVKAATTGARPLLSAASSSMQPSQLALAQSWKPSRTRVRICMPPPAECSSPSGNRFGRVQGQPHRSRCATMNKLRIFTFTNSRNHVVVAEHKSEHVPTSGSKRCSLANITSS